MLQQGDAGADVNGVVQVVAGDEDGGAVFLVIGPQQVLDDGLAGGVEEVEGFVQDEQPGVVQHGADDAYLLLVAHGVIADEFLLSQDLAVHEAVEGAEAFVHVILLQPVHAADEVEVFFGREVVDEEAVVDVRAGDVLPVLGAGDVRPGDGHRALVGLHQVQDEAEQGGLARAVVAHQAQHVAVGDGVVFDVDGPFRAVGLLQVGYFYHKQSVLVVSI